MAVKMTNTSEKVIGVGELAVLPGETKEVPSAFEGSPILEVYKNMGMITLSGKARPEADKKDAEDSVKAEGANANAEAYKKAKLDAIKDASDEDVAKWANELGINPADCKDLADVRKKVKAALSK